MNANHPDLVAERDWRRWLIPALLAIPSIFLSLFPSIETANLEFALFDLPILLVLIWFGWRRALLATALGATIGMIAWGASELQSWVALYGNTLLLVVFITSVRSAYPRLGLSIAGLAYWILLGVPVTILIFWLQHFDIDYAVVSTGQRLFSGTTAITAAITLHFVILLAQHRLPQSLYGDRNRLKIRMNEITATAAIVAMAIPLLFVLWAMVNNEIESEIETMFAASDARFESLAQSASANLSEQRTVLSRLAPAITEDIQDGSFVKQEFDDLLLEALKVKNVLGFIIKSTAKTESPYLSSGLIDINLPAGALINALESNAPAIPIQLGQDAAGPTAFIATSGYPRLMFVYASQLDFWESLYRADMLGLMGNSVGGMIDRVSHFHGPSTQELYGIASDAQIVKEEYDYAIWIPPARSDSSNAVFERVKKLKNSYITFQASDDLINSFDNELFDVDCFRYTVDFWSYISETLINLSILIFGATGLLLLMACMIEIVVWRFSQPFLQLADAMERFSEERTSNKNEVFSFDLTGTTDLFQQLAMGFNQMERAVNAASANTVALNSSYESLLSRAKLGFIAQDHAGHILYANPAAETLLAEPDGLPEKISSDFFASDDVASLTINHNDQTLNLLVTQAPRLNLTGEDDGRWIIISDISAIKATERNLLEAQRLSTLGQLTTGMAHEINQPLQAITLTVANLRRKLEAPLAENPAAEDKLGKIDRHLRQIANLIKFMKTYGGSGSSTEVIFDPITSIDDATKDGQQDYANTLNIVLNDMTESNCHLQGDSGQLKVVISHLLKNAHDAATTVNKQSLRTMTITVRTDGACLLITASDDCGGVKPEVLPYIFDPFFTTKDPDKGIGLGLSVSLGIIKSMGGNISAENAQTGAEFQITLPLV